MRHRDTNKKLKREKAPRKALIFNLTRSLILEDQIETTLTKAKVVQSNVERLITLSKKKDLATKQLLTKKLPDKLAVKKLINELAKRFASREGGYTSIKKMGYRQGDGATMARISILTGK